MENRNFFESLTQYRLKVERDGKSVVNVPGIFCLPVLFAAPTVTIAGAIAAPLLGYSLHLETENDAGADLDASVRKAADLVKETASTAARTIREEIDRAFEEARKADEEAAEEIPEEESGEAPGEAADECGPDAEAQAAASENEDLVAGLEDRAEEPGVPTIRVNPDDTARA